MVSVYGTEGSVLSVTVAEMREIERHGQMVRTGIWKRLVEGPLTVRGVNVEGDDQGDRSVHGGPDKAVYACPREDIDWWERDLGSELPDGVFGENLGDAVELVSRPDHDLSIAAFAHAFLGDRSQLPRLLIPRCPRPGGTGCV